MSPELRGIIQSAVTNLDELMEESPNRKLADTSNMLQELLDLEEDQS